MGASRAVLLPRIKPRRRYFGGGSENEDPTACTTPHPDKKTRPRSLTRAQSQSSGTRSSEAVVPSGDAGRRPGRHDRSVSEASVSTSTRTFGVGGNEGNDEGFFDRSKNASRRERLERLRVETRAAGTRAHPRRRFRRFFRFFRFCRHRRPSRAPPSSRPAPSSVSSARRKPRAWSGLPVAFALCSPSAESGNRAAESRWNAGSRSARRSRERGGREASRAPNLRGRVP